MVRSTTGDAISKFRFTHEKGLVDPLRNFPPPAFSHTPLPLNYGYRQNPHVIKVMIRGKDVSFFLPIIVGISNSKAKNL